MHIKEKDNLLHNKAQAMQRLLEKGHQTIIITIHKNPDADALGSALAWTKFLKKKGHSVYVISPNRYPSFLAWMLEEEKVFIFEEDNQELLKQHIKKADIIFCLDFPKLSRLFVLGPIIQRSQATKVLIDHHLNPDPFADISISEPQASATALIIYKVLVAINEARSITPSIANCLYAGILTDTGCFQNPNTNAETHRVAGELLEKGVNVNQINQKLYQSFSLTRLKFIAHMISNRLTVLPEIKTAYFTIPQKDFVTFKLEPGDTEGLVNYGLSLKDISCAALLIQHTENVRLSLRSKGEIAVNKIAKKHFNGGGHKNAAGGSSSLSLLETAKKLTSILEKEYFTTK